jgi:TolB protein
VDLTMPVRSVLRSLAVGLCLLGAAVATVPSAVAQLSLRVGPGSQFQPMPIAIADFAGEGDLGPARLRHHRQQPAALGYFAILDKGRFPERPSFDTAPRFEAWRAAGAQALVTGRVLRDPSGRIRAEFRLWDVYAGQQTTGQQYVTDSNFWRRVGHIISDAVFTKITGVGGFFDTRVVFVDESGPKENRRKRLAIMDQDGANVRFLTQGDSLGRDAALLAREPGHHLHVPASGQQPRVHVINLEPARARSSATSPT